MPFSKNVRSERSPAKSPNGGPGGFDALSSRMFPTTALFEADWSARNSGVTVGSNGRPGIPKGGGHWYGVPISGRQ